MPRLRIDAKVTGRWLLVSAAALTALGLLSEVALFHWGEGPVRALTVVRSAGAFNLITYASTLLLAAGGVLAFWLGADEKGRVRRRWWCLASGLAYLSLDEAIGLHERWHRLVPVWAPQDGAFHMQWVLVGIPVALVGMVALLWLVAGLPRRTRLGLVAAGLVYVIGALGGEMVGGALIGASGSRTLAFYVETSVEEGLEMLGIVLALRALLGQAAATGAAASVDVYQPNEEGEPTRTAGSP